MVIGSILSGFRLNDRLSQRVFRLSSPINAFYKRSSSGIQKFQLQFVSSFLSISSNNGFRFGFLDECCRIVASQPNLPRTVMKRDDKHGQHKPSQPKYRTSHYVVTPGAGTVEARCRGTPHRLNAGSNSAKSKAPNPTAITATSRRPKLSPGCG